MKLAIVVPGGVDASGTERVIPVLLWLVERLARRHTVHVFATRQQAAPAHWTLLGAQVHNVGTDGAWRRRLFAWFAAEHACAPFHAVHGIFGGAGTYAALLGRRHRLPVLLHLAGGEPVALHDIGYGMRCTLRGRLSLRVAVAGAHRVTVATPYMQRLADAVGIATELVPLGVALDRWPPRAPRLRDPSMPARLLHVGDLRPVKDQTTLLAAAAALREAGVRFRLDVAGHDTLHGAVQRETRARGLGDVTRFHGVLRREALRALMDEAHLLLVSSRHDAGPLVVLEAAVAGVPTVGTAVGHVAEWAPYAAVAVPVGDARALAHATAALLTDEPWRLTLAHAALRRATTHDADYTAACFERMYEEVGRDMRHEARDARGTAEAPGAARNGKWPATS
jgi:glycosyltransferase involved in cell wall biosynthesis